MKKVVNWLVDKWLGGFITAGFFFLIDKYNSLPNTSKLNFFSFNWLKDLLKQEISILTLLIILSIVIILSLIDKHRFKNTVYTQEKKKNSPKNKFASYCEDSFGINNSKWSWEYKWNNSDKSFNVVNLLPLCPRCNIPLNVNFRNAPSNGYCYKCKLDGKQENHYVREKVTDVESEIIRKINKGEIKTK